MNTFNVPVREEVGADNQQIFDNLKSKLGFVPNLYAAMIDIKGGFDAIKNSGFFVTDYVCASTKK